MTTTNAERLAAGLPEWLPRGPETQNARLLEAVGEALDHIQADMRDVQNAVHPQTADTIDQLDQIGSRMGITHRSGESKETYRIRVMAAHQLLTSGGTLGEIISNIATLLNISPRNIQIEEMIEPGTVPMTIPSSAIMDSGLSSEVLAGILKNQIAAGYRIDVVEFGTLEYISEEEYNTGTYDATAGYDGLGGDGIADDDGGTYGGLLN